MLKVKKKEKSLVCCVCGKTVKNEKELFIYFDSANRAITKMMADKGYCKQCYEKKWSY
jgi:hypothetical protein